MDIPRQSPARKRRILRVVYAFSGLLAILIITLRQGMAGVALLAGYLPARRATRVDPMVALRYE